MSNNHRSVIALSFLGLVVTAALLVCAVAAGPALAGKKGNGNGNHVSAVVSVAPDPVAAHTAPTVTGSGFTAGTRLLVGIPGDVRFQDVTVDSTGGFSFVYSFRDLVPETFTMEAWGQGSGGRWELKAGTTFTVVP